MSTAAPLPDAVGTAQAPLPTLEQLPDDLLTLKLMVLELATTVREERHAKDALQQRIDLLLRRLFGPRSERYRPDQPLLFGDDVLGADQNPAAAAEPPPPRSRRPRQAKPHGRQKLPEDLPRRPLHHQLSAAERLCVCGQARVEIGVDVSEQLDWQPASFFVWQHLIHKYACLNCRANTADTTMTSPDQLPVDTAASAIADSAPAEPTAATMLPADGAQAEPIATLPADARPASVLPQPKGATVIAAVKPAMPIAKGLPGPGLLAQVIVSKYFDHLPLHRQENIYRRQGVRLARSTTCDWMAACAELLRPLYDLMVQAVLQSLWLHTDDTPVKNLGHDVGATDKARFWIYWGDRTHPYNVFDFTVNRKRDGPQTFLADFHGYLHADAFSGYDALYLPQPRAGAAPIVEVACNAHARRRFDEARLSDALGAHRALAYYGQLYELERSAQRVGLDDDQRRQMRQELSLVILEKFQAWLIEQRDQVLPKSPMAEAVGYALNNWTALIRFTEQGYLSIDNNVAEREMKRIAVGRKNWLFVGSAKGGRTAAVLYSFTSTCHRLGIEPWAYLQDVLTQLPGLASERLGELLPDRWLAAHPQAVLKPAASSAPTPSTPASPS
jgi:transposase